MYELCNSKVRVVWGIPRVLCAVCALQYTPTLNAQLSQPIVSCSDPSGLGL